MTVTEPTLTSGGEPPTDSMPVALSKALLRRWVLLVVAAGVGWRVGRWLLAMPMWGDEAMLGLNVVDRSFAELSQPLEMAQVAPLLFLWVQKAVMNVLGAGDLAVRLAPTLASLAALLLFVRLARRCLSPLHAAMSVGFLAVSYYTVRHGCEFKPYSFDLLAAVVVLSLAQAWLSRPHARAAPIALIAATPILLGASNPAIFVSAAAGSILFVHAVRRRERSNILLAALHIVVILASFALFFFAVTRGQDTAVGEGMRQYWNEAFPPANPLRFLLWLFDAHTGNLFAYPIGGKRGGSTLTFLLAITGVIHLWRTGQRPLLALLLLPFAFTFAAAVMQRYPYGFSARVAQHLAPAICLLAGCGAAAMILRFQRSTRGVTRAAAAAFIAFIVIGIAGLVQDVMKPYKTKPDLEVRAIVDRAFERSADHRVIVVSDAARGIPPTFLWYLKTRPGTYSINPDSIPDSESKDVSALIFTTRKRPLDRLEEALGQLNTPARRREDHTYSLQIGPRERGPDYCRSIWWTADERGDGVH